MALIIGIDVGGTFTDMVAYDSTAPSFTHAKTLTRYGRFVDGALACLAEAGLRLADAGVVKHGTTQVINAFVQRSGARTVLVTTEGFRDSLEIGRSNRPIAFQLRWERGAPLVPRPLRLTVRERMAADGEVVKPLTQATLEEVGDRVAALAPEAIAVSFINAYRNPMHERMAADYLRARFPDLPVSAGTDLTREWFEYERTSTAVANAYVGPAMRRYLRDFDDGLAEGGFAGRLTMMASNGGVLGVRTAQEQPIALVESGPIGGCIAASRFARALDLPDMIAFDMGGTTAKCALITAGSFEVQSTYYIGGYEHGFPIRAPVVDIVEVGAGGGSIAHVDAQRRLRVGPQSAGSEPGPACFGRGGTQPTVTDANLLLGRIGGDVFLGGQLRLDEDAARAAMRRAVADPLEVGIDQAAHGVLAIACTVMATAINEITGERGHDVRGFSLMAFGGSGPLHASQLARDLHIPLVIIPPEPGNFAAVGMLLAQPRVDNVRSFLHDLDASAVARLGASFAELEAETRALLLAEIASDLVACDDFLEIRYKGQKHTVRVAVTAHDAGNIRRDFEAAYRARYGHADAAHPVEIVSLRVVATAETAVPDIAHLRGKAEGSAERIGERSVYFDGAGRVTTPRYRRDDLPVGFVTQGPAIIEEYGSTTIVAPGDVVAVGAFGELRIEHRSGDR